MEQSYRQIFLVRSDETGLFLNRKGGWSRSPLSYRLAEFASEEAAQAGFPAGNRCSTLAYTLPNPPEVKS